jgi:hypothetical protein
MFYNKTILSPGNVRKKSNFSKALLHQPCTAPPEAISASVGQRRAPARTVCWAESVLIKTNGSVDELHRAGVKLLLCAEGINASSSKLTLWASPHTNLASRSKWQFPSSSTDNTNCSGDRMTCQRQGKRECWERANCEDLLMDWFHRVYSSH